LNTVVLGVSFDPPEANKAFRDKFDFPYNLLSDTDKTASVAYGAAADGAAKNAARVSVLIGPDGRVAAAYGAVTPAEHPEQVLADLKRLG
jgi:peroxiredoxin Q/BCP